MTKDKPLAFSMRAEGHPYKEISKATGYSEAWCKKNLKGVSKGTQPHIQAIVDKATSRTGCSNGELLGILIEHNKHMTIKGAKKAAMEISKHCVFRPDWMDGEHPIQSKTLMYSLVDELFHAIQERVEFYQECYPNTYGPAVAQELVRLAFDPVCPGGVFSRLEYHDKIVEELLS